MARIFIWKRGLCAAAIVAALGAIYPAYKACKAVCNMYQEHKDNIVTFTFPEKRRTMNCEGRQVSYVETNKGAKVVVEYGPKRFVLIDEDKSDKPSQLELITVETRYLKEPDNESAGVDEPKTQKETFRSDKNYVTQESLDQRDAMFKLGNQWYMIVRGLAGRNTVQETVANATANPEQAKKLAQEARKAQYEQSIRYFQVPQPRK